MASLSSPPKVALSEKETLAYPGTIITEEELPNTPASLQFGTTNNIQGALADLLLGAFLPCIPVVLVCVVLLAIIFHYRADLDPGWHSLQAPSAYNGTNQTVLDELTRLGSNGGTPDYLIHFNPGLLVAIASWTLKIIPFVTPFSMALVAFFAGHHILNATQSHETGQLPTPHQTSLLIGLLTGGGAQPLWDVIKYRRQHPERLVPPITVAFAALAFIVFNTFAIGAAETWFGAATQPVNQPIIIRHDKPVLSYGRGFNTSYCGENIWAPYPCPSNAAAECNYPCSITSWNHTTKLNGTQAKQGVTHAQEAAQTLLNNSATNQIRNTTTSISTNEHGTNDTLQFYFLGDARAGGNKTDFLTDTTAVTTSCEVVTQECTLGPDNTGFSCPWGYKSDSSTFSGEVGVDASTVPNSINDSAVGIQFFKDADLTRPVGLGNQSTELFSAQNPIYFMHWSKGFPPMDTSTSTFDAMTSGGYLKTDSSGDNVFILNCSMTIYSTIYAWVNGSILSVNAKQSWYPTLAEDEYGAIYSAPFAINSAEGNLALSDAAAIAAYGTTPNELASTFANGFSSAAVALTAGIYMPALNMLEQSRNGTELLTRVPKIPLYLLISLKGLYVVFSLALAALAVAHARPTEAQQAKVRLTVDGLAAGLFEPHEQQERAVETTEELYAEHDKVGARDLERGADGATKKVGLRQAQAGGWVWVVREGHQEGKRYGRAAYERISVQADDAADKGSG
ncbi:MAG: hypothetical protein M1821_008433 [Bathelium mastoideum]|nr:MAG: hypothetical protein M1821_008433 [Bathelium mastoideum]KAI9687094.1 MAG: hypothetical protein M1822_002504 [Bathelium mastoideum]